MIRVFIADDHFVVRHGIRQLLAETEDLELVGEATNGRELLQAAASGERWDVVVLDLSLPRVSGIEALRRLRELLPTAAVVVLSMYPEEQYGLRVMREGAAAYLSKDRSGEELIAAIRRAASGGRYLTELLASQALSAPSQAKKLPHETLTSREYQVFTFVINGKTVSEIAAELDVTVSTVSGYLRNVKEKLGARSVADIVNYAHRMKFLG
ncbi:MAG: response regulator transcription factor [Minicystis sp.]